jgi:putative transposase
VAEHKLSVSRACGCMSLSRAAYYKRGIDWSKRDAPVIEALNMVVGQHGRWGFWKCYGRIRLDEHFWNHKRVYRVYCAMGLNMKRRTKKRVPVRERQSMGVPNIPNRIWALDFMSDTLYSGRRFRVLNVLDEGVREALDIVIDTSLPAGRLVRVMEELREWRGLPGAIRCDNGPELTSQSFVDWCGDNGIEILYIQPGKPVQNAYIERFNRTLREEVLDAYLFTDLEQAQHMANDWLRSYNEQRPHESLGGLPPTLFREKVTAKSSTLKLST